MSGETPIRADHRRELLEQCLQTMRVELDAADSPEDAVTVVATWADALGLLMERPVCAPVTPKQPQLDASVLVYQHHDPFSIFV